VSWAAGIQPLRTLCAPSSTVFPGWLWCRCQCPVASPCHSSTLSCRISSSSLDNYKCTVRQLCPFSAVRARRCSRAAENKPGALTRQLMEPGGTGSVRRTAVIAINGDSSDKQQAIVAELLDRQPGLRTVPLRQEGFATETPERQNASTADRDRDHTTANLDSRGATLWRCITMVPCL
jgi:hypothetical protein